MLKSCKYCGKIHDSKINCGKKPTAYRTAAEQGRYTSEWDRKSEDIKERSLYLCAVCRDKELYVYEGLETHHIIRLRDRPDLLLEDSNLVCLCVPCHKLAERGEISAGYLSKLAKMRDVSAFAYPPTV